MACATLQPCGHASVCNSCAEVACSTIAGCPLCNESCSSFDPGDALSSDGPLFHCYDGVNASLLLQIVPRELWANTATLLTTADDTTETGAKAPTVKLPGKAGYAANAMNAARSAMLTSTAVSHCGDGDGDGGLSGGSDTAKWQWMDDSGTWIAYDPAATSTLEQGYSAQHPGVDLGQNDWYVDFEVMRQKNTRLGTERPVQRVKNSEAGLFPSVDTGSTVGGASTQQAFSSLSLLQVIADEARQGPETRVAT
jgi:hypothetical protein